MTTITSHITGLPAVELGDHEHLTSTLWERARSQPSAVKLRYPRGGAWEDLTWGALAQRVRELAAGLVEAGVGVGDRVALMSATRVEWTIADMAVLAAGAVTVPIFETSSQEQCAWILSDAGVTLAIAGSADAGKTLDAARVEAPSVSEVLVIDDGGLDALAERATDAGRQAVDERLAGLRSHDLASIIYTSGTTGNPKGCVLTHRNLLGTARGAIRVLPELFSEQDATLLFLPLAHVFARIIQIGSLESPIMLGYARGMEHLREDLAALRPTFVLGVPRVLEKIYHGAQRKAGGGLKGAIFARAAAVGQRWSQSERPGLLLGLQRGLYDRLVYSKLREAMGGQVAYCVSGGAPLAPHIAHFFNAAGIVILEGYGLTETSAASVANPASRNIIGTVGVPIAGFEAGIAGDGEVLLRGVGVFRGYWQNDDATRMALGEEGWFHTGDMGEVTAAGHLRITGRKKELIVTAAGKNVAPAVLEERLKAHALVSQAMVVGDGRPFVGALLTLDRDELEAFAAEHGLASADPAQVGEDPLVRAELQQAVDHANAAVSRAESIRRFEVLPRDFSEPDGELTPTLKLKRPVVSRTFADAIERIYHQG